MPARRPPLPVRRGGQGRTLMSIFAYALGIAIGVLAFAAAIVAPAATRNAPLDRTVPAAGVVDRAIVKVKRIAATD